MSKNWISRPIICKIEIIEHGKSVMDYKGDLGTGFDRIKTMCEDVFQIKEKVDKNDTEK